MAQRIEVGERVCGHTGSTGRYGTRQVVGTLRQRPTTREDPYLIHVDGDPEGIETPVYKIRRV
jgi:hypothetical protein